jgi:thioredoxin 1
MEEGGRVFSKKLNDAAMETNVKRKSFDEILKSSPLVLVDFFTEWCGPCKMMKPILEEVKMAVGEAVKIIKIDVEKNVHVASQFEVTGVPTFVLFKNGRAVWRKSGVISPSVLRQVIDAHR